MQLYYIILGGQVYSFIEAICVDRHFLKLFISLQLPLPSPVRYKPIQTIHFYRIFCVSSHERFRWLQCISGQFPSWASDFHHLVAAMLAGMCWSPWPSPWTRVMAVILTVHVFIPSLNFKIQCTCRFILHFFSRRWPCICLALRKRWFQLGSSSRIYFKAIYFLRSFILQANWAIYYL